MSLQKSLSAIICCGILLLACKEQPSAYDTIFTLFKNAEKPMPFAPELALKGNVYKGCFSNDYSRFYFFRSDTPGRERYRIFQASWKGHKWTDVKWMSFSDSNADLYPLASVVENDKLFFISYRRTPEDTSTKPNANFWYTEQKGNGWTIPAPLKAANLIYNYNSQPCMARNGNIYFTSDLPDWSKILTYKMEFSNGNYQPPVPFGFVNQLRQRDTTKIFWEICISPDEEYMVMTISEKGKEARLHVSYKNKEEWTDPVYIGDIINGDMAGNFPYITKDGAFLLFTREFSSFYILPTRTFARKYQ